MSSVPDQQAKGTVTRTEKVVKALRDLGGIASVKEILNTLNYLDETEVRLEIMDLVEANMVRLSEKTPGKWELRGDLV